MTLSWPNRRLLDLAGIEKPIVLAPMGGAVTPEMAAAVSNAGGLGMLALSWGSPEAVRQDIRRTRALTDKPFGVNLVLEYDQRERFAVCLEENVPVLSFFWGDSAPFVDPAHEAGAIVMHTASSAAEARAVLASGVDCIIAQGWEAGGHVQGEVSTMALVPAIVDVAGDAPVVAAGGIADGRGLAAAFALGASGAWIGTRFLGALEADIHDHYAERLLQAGEADTLHTFDLYDVGWRKAPHRTLKSETSRLWEEAGRPASGVRPGENEVVAQSAAKGDIVRYSSSTPNKATSGNIEALSMWAGQGVGLLTKRQSAAEITNEIINDAAAVLNGLARR